MSKKFATLSLLALLALPAGLAQDLNGAGASFPYPLYSTMFDAYHQEFGIEVNYQSIGSGGGQRQMLEQTVDFGGSDSPMMDEALGDAPNSGTTGGPNPLLHVPVALAAVVPTYDFTPVAANPETPLRFTGEVLAEIYLGGITNWSDSRLQELNPDFSLPDLDITVVHRADASGTTSIFVDYLAKASGRWAEEVSQGPQTSVAWPVGYGGRGNDGVASLVSQTPGAIGYVAHEYAVANGLGIALVQNRAGNFIEANLDSVAAAADVELPADMRATFTDTTNPDGFPIAGFTWVLVYGDQEYAGRTREQAQQTVDLIRWMITDGQRFNNDLNYARVVGAAQEGGLRLLDDISYGEEPLD